MPANVRHVPFLMASFRLSIERQIMRKTWNAFTRTYDYIQEGLLVDGIDYTFKAAMEKWAQRKGAASCRKSTAQRIVKRMVEDHEIYDKHHLWLEKIEERVIAENHALIYPARGKTGDLGTIQWAQIPVTYRTALLDIANGQGANWSRGPHQTCPAKEAGGFTNSIEYHLNAKKDGRATTALRSGSMYIYYSTMHSFATYNYHLVIFPMKINTMTDALDVPLTGEPRDKLIVLPTA
jgi:hypothetical protein